MNLVLSSLPFTNVVVSAVGREHIIIIIEDTVGMP